MQNSTWRVLKFGGTSVASLEQWCRIERIIRAHRRAGSRPLVVCSALSGVTNMLEALLDAMAGGEPTGPHLDRIEQTHRALADRMGVSCEALLGETLGHLADLAAAGQTEPASRAAVLACGEMMSTRLGAAWLNRRGLRTGWLDARRLLASRPADADSDGVGDSGQALSAPSLSAHYLSAECDAGPDAALQARLDALVEPVLVTQGFIASDEHGDTVVLGRGGSDTTAAYLASKLDAERVEIWTDVPGTFSTNPRANDRARLLRRLGANEVSVMAALGAKVLHPRSLGPVRTANLPLMIRWTRHPDLPAGTLIEPSGHQDGAKAVATRRHICALVMERPLTWQPVGFMAEVAQRFADHGLSMDLLASSPGSSKVTVDLQAFPGARTRLDDLVRDLSEVSEVSVLDDVACVSVVGEGVSADVWRVSPALSELDRASVHFVAHGANDMHVSYVVDDDAADHIQDVVHAALFDDRPVDGVVGPDWAWLETHAESLARSGWPDEATPA
jgi:diaminopimelate decarboxylase/aspartate kinase